MYVKMFLLVEGTKSYSPDNVILTDIPLAMINPTGITILFRPQGLGWIRSGSFPSLAAYG